MSVGFYSDIKICKWKIKFILSNFYNYGKNCCINNVKEMEFFSKILDIHLFVYIFVIVSVRVK